MTCKCTLDNHSLLVHTQRAVENGAKGVREPWEEKDDHGTVVMATVRTVSSTL